MSKYLVKRILLAILSVFVICLIFTLVTNGLERIKRYLLRWQNGVTK